MIGMDEIDRRRALLGDARAKLKTVLQNYPHGIYCPCGSCIYTEGPYEAARNAVSNAESYVLQGLREWWAQAEYHNHEADSGSLLALLAYVNLVVERGPGSRVPWHVVENLKSASDLIRKRLNG